MIEVPDKEDDIAYQLWLTKGKTTPNSTLDMTVPTPSKTAPTMPMESPQPGRWLERFEVDWTLHTQCCQLNAK